MFLAIFFIVLGALLLLNAIGITVGVNVWGFFWAFVFLAIGIKMLKHKRGGCPMCSVKWWKGRMYDSDCQGDCEHEKETSKRTRKQKDSQ